MNTRIAPSPTGDVHFGLIRTLYINYLEAKTTGGKFILRIDDTDKGRNKGNAVQEIIDLFDFLGLEYDQIVFQSARAARYEKALINLTANNMAVEVDGAIVLNNSWDMSEWRDAVIGSVKVSKQTLEDSRAIILARSDRSATYHLASVVDDIELGIDHIIRGVDHIQNTPRQMFIFDALGARIPKFSHIGLIFNGPVKMSKRDNTVGLNFYRQFHPEAILNLALKSGWAHPDSDIDRKHPLINRELALELYPQGHLRSQKSNFDVEKLKWFHKKYVK